MIQDDYVNMHPAPVCDTGSGKKAALFQDRSSGEESSETDPDGYLKMHHVNR